MHRNERIKRCGNGSIVPSASDLSSTFMNSSEETLDVRQNAKEMTYYDEREANRHLRGWLTYAVASEVFVAVSLGLFLPICLEQFARDNGYLLSDKTTPCSTIKITPSNMTEGSRCVVKIGWAWIDTASFSLYVHSISVACQSVVSISIGGIADLPSHRKHALILCAAVGSTAAMLFLILPSSSPLWPLVAFFGTLASVGFSASAVVMNAYLPTLASEDRQVVAALENLRASEGGERVMGRSSEEQDLHLSAHEEPLLRSDREAYPGSQVLREEYTTLVSQTTTRISSSGIALSHLAGIAGLIMALVLVTLMGESTFSLRLAISASGLFWAIFTVPARSWLPNDSLIDGEEGSDRLYAPYKNDLSLTREVRKAWQRLFEMLHWRQITRLKHTFRFLAAWFILSDGFKAITSTIILFAKTQLHMSAGTLIIVGLLSNASIILGAIAWPRVQKQFGLSNKRVLVLLLFLSSFVPLYGCLGFLIFRPSPPSPPSPSADTVAPHFGGLTTPGEMYGLALYFGSVMGAFIAYARAVYAELIPRGEEAQWYALYSITDKSSAFLSPLVAGVIADATGNMRYSFFFSLAMVWSALPLLGTVNPERGKEDADRYGRHGQPGVYSDWVELRATSDTEFSAGGTTGGRRLRSE